jgi:DMSO reductase anchor subunit
MCVDRLEVGLKPACVSACVGNALDFGVIETTPENRRQAKTTIPGFPDPEISKPNIRFQQTQSLPSEFTRTDSAPIKYTRAADSSSYAPVVDLKSSQARQWNLAQLSSRENPLVIFTLVTQAVIGAFGIAFLGAMAGLESLGLLVSSTIAAPLVICLAALQAFVLFLSTRHLGKPLRFYRGFNNLRYSPLSREALAIAVFFGLLPLVAGLLMVQYGFFDLIQAGALQKSVLPWLSSNMLRAAVTTLIALALPIAMLGLYFMHSIYRIKARPFWDHWQVLSSFFGTMFSLGAILLGFLSMPMAWIAGTGGDGLIDGLIVELAPLVLTGLLIEALGHYYHARDLQVEGREGAASLVIMYTKFGKTYRLRNVSLAVCLLAALTITLLGDQLMNSGWQFKLLVCALASTCLFTALVSRALFYVIVIPTTMPGAFFWKNKGFEEHARATGLAKMPQLGVVEFDH